MEVNDRVTVADKQLVGNCDLLVDGAVVAISGNSAKVQIDGEESPRVFALDQLKTSEEVYGAERTSNYDNAVIDGIRRH